MVVVVGYVLVAMLVLHVAVIVAMVHEVVVFDMENVLVNIVVLYVVVAGVLIEFNVYVVHVAVFLFFLI